jgi:hypothetical protein
MGKWKVKIEDHHRFVWVVDLFLGSTVYPPHPPSLLLQLRRTAPVRRPAAPTHSFVTCTDRGHGLQVFGEIGNTFVATF